jgi:hypothetical protein
MAEEGDSRGPGRRIGDEAKAVFVRALRLGLRLEDAAEVAGFTLHGFYGARRRDPAFDAACRAALAGSAADERRPAAYAAAGALDRAEGAVAANNRRPLQKRKMRHVRFDAARQERFLNHLAGCCDVAAAAAAAGVDESTVYTHRRKDPVFAAAFQEALEQGYVRLEAEALRQRLEAQRRLRAALDEGTPTGEIAAEFERVIKLLRRWDRKCERPGMRSIARGRQPGLTFEEAIETLAKKLRNLDIPILELPAEIAARYDRDDGGDKDGGS